jgi:hypothetical protein
MSGGESYLWDITVSGSDLPPTDMPQRIAHDGSRELAKPTGYIKPEEQ